METIREQRPAVGIDAGSRPIRRPARGPVWPLVVAGMALLAVVVAGLSFTLGDDTAAFTMDGAVIEHSSAWVREQGPYAVPIQAPYEPEALMTESREGGAYGSAPAASTGVSETESREGGAYADSSG